MVGKQIVLKKLHGGRNRNPVKKDGEETNYFKKTSQKCCEKDGISEETNDLTLKQQQKNITVAQML